MVKKSEKNKSNIITNRTVTKGEKGVRIVHEQHDKNCKDEGLKEAIEAANKEIFKKKEPRLCITCILSKNHEYVSSILGSKISSYDVFETIRTLAEQVETALGFDKGSFLQHMLLVSIRNSINPEEVPSNWEKFAHEGTGKGH